MAKTVKKLKIKKKKKHKLPTSGIQEDITTDPTGVKKNKDAMPLTVTTQIKWTNFFKKQKLLKLIQEQM